MSPGRNYPNSRLYLKPEQAELIRELFRYRGCLNGEAIGAALYKTKACSGVYTKEHSVSTIIRNVLRGNRAIPYPMVEGITELFENDERLQFLREQPKSLPYGHRSKLIKRAYHGDPMDRVLLSYFDFIRDNYTELESQGKNEVLGQLEEVVKRLESKTPLSRKPKWNFWR